jgi:hypothetical protein
MWNLEIQGKLKFARRGEIKPAFMDTAHMWNIVIWNMM